MNTEEFANQQPNNGENDSQQISRRVLEVIKKGEIQMRPHWQFLLKRILMILGIIILFITSFYLVSFIIFSLRETGLWFAPAFGSRGWLSLLKFFPWLLVLVSLLFIGVLELLVRKYSFAYRRPLLFSLLLILLLVSLLSYYFADWQQPIYLKAIDNHWPLAETFYFNAGRERPDGLRRGRVIQAGDGLYIIQNSRGATTTVLVGPNTHLPHDCMINSGDMLIIFGNEGEKMIQAIDIRQIYR